MCGATGSPQNVHLSMHPHRKTRTNTDIDINTSAWATGSHAAITSSCTHAHTHEHVCPRAQLPTPSRTQKEVRRTRIHTHAQPCSGARTATQPRSGARSAQRPMRRRSGRVNRARCPAARCGLCLRHYGAITTKHSKDEKTWHAFGITVKKTQPGDRRNLVYCTARRHELFALWQTASSLGRSAT